MSGGGAREKNGRWYANARFGKGERLEFRVPWAKSAEEAIERALVMADVAELLVTSGRRDLVRATLRQLAEASTPKRLETVRKAAKAIVDGAIKAGHAHDITIRQWGERYTTGELSRLWPDHVKVKDWSDDISRLRAYVYPLVGGVPVRAFTYQHAAQVLAALPPAKVRREATRRHVGQIIGRLMRLAVFPGQLIEISPLPPGWLPKITDRRHYTCLFPREEEQHLRHEDTAIALRLFCGVLDREGMRITELWDSEWFQWNLIEGTFRATKTKTHDPRMWAVRPDTAEAMRIWRRLRPDTARPFAELDELVADRTKIADVYRRSLKAAGIDRPELFETTEHAGQLRAHDMRATFVTISIAEGRSSEWIRDRTAHKSTSMIDRYRRQARQFSELKVGPLCDLVVALGWWKGGGKAPPPTPEESGLSMRSTEGRTRTGTYVSTADFESEAGSSRGSDEPVFPVEVDGAERSDSAFHHLSTTPSCTLQPPHGGPNLEVNLSMGSPFATAARAPGVARTRVSSGAVGVRLEREDGTLLARTDIDPGDPIEDVETRLKAAALQGRGRR